jgi:hypothetical protein
MGSEPRAMSL